jgi:hypothetical protein
MLTSAFNLLLVIIKIIVCSNTYNKLRAAYLVSQEHLNKRFRAPQVFQALYDLGLGSAKDANKRL